MPRCFAAVARNTRCLAAFEPGRLIELETLRAGLVGEAIETAAGPAARPSRML